MNANAIGSVVSLPTRIILVSPQNSENVGAVARVMKNFGFTQLVVVDPRCEITIDGAAGWMACHAEDVLKNRRECTSLAEALAGSTFSIALTRQAGEHRPSDFAGFVPVPLLSNRPSNETRAIVFGREDKGLTSEECALCTARWALPTNQECPSLNLAQAVAVALSGLAQVEWRQPSDEQSGTLATHDQVAAMLTHWEEVLRSSGYERGVPLPQMMRRFRRMALRGQLSQHEVGLLRGAFRRILNAILGHERRR